MSTDDRDRGSPLPPEDDWFAEVDEPAAPTAPPATRRERAEQEPGPPRRPPERSRLLALGGIAAAVVLIVGGIVIARALGDSDDSGTTTTSTLPTAPVVPTPPPPTPPPATTTETTPDETTDPGDGTTPTLPPDGSYRRGDQGDSVLAIQQALTQLGFEPGDVDGNFGEQTETAVIAFQNSADLTADGVVGSATLAALTQALGTERG